MNIKHLAAGASMLAALHAAMAEEPSHTVDMRTCLQGTSQSPINIDTHEIIDALSDSALDFRYRAGPAVVSNPGHTVQVNLQPGSSIALEGADFELKQFHFHTPSEETFNGKAFPLVAHLVHQNAKGEIAVVAVLFKLGAENTVLEPIFAHLPKHKAVTVHLDSFSPTDLLPSNHSHYDFMGSLTTPPCTENVRWRVISTPLEVSEGQLEAFRKLYPANARAVQPRNGRRISIRKH